VASQSAFEREPEKCRNVSRKLGVEEELVSRGAGRALEGAGRGYNGERKGFDRNRKGDMAR